MRIQRVAVSIVAMTLLGFVIASSIPQSRVMEPGTKPVAANGPKGRIVVDDLGGEGVRPRITISNYSWGVSNTSTTTSGGGASAGRAVFAPFSFEKAIDDNSVAIATAASNGRHFPTATVTLFEPGTTKPLSIFTLTNVSVGGTTHESKSIPTESVSLNYEKIKWVYKASAADLTFCWDVAGSIGC